MAPWRNMPLWSSPMWNLSHTPYRWWMGLSCLITIFAWRGGLGLSMTTTVLRHPPHILGITWTPLQGGVTGVALIIIAQGLMEWRRGRGDLLLLLPPSCLSHHTWVNTVTCSDWCIIVYIYFLAKFWQADFRWCCWSRGDHLWLTGHSCLFTYYLN